MRYELLEVGNGLALLKKLELQTDKIQQQMRKLSENLFSTAKKVIIYP